VSAEEECHSLLILFQGQPLGEVTGVSFHCDLDFWIVSCDHAQGFCCPCEVRSCHDSCSCSCSESQSFSHFCQNHGGGACGFETAGSCAGLTGLLVQLES